MTTRARNRARLVLCMLSAAWTGSIGAGSPIRSVTEVETRGGNVVERYADRELAELGFLDVTKAPYSADPTGREDATEAIQRAIDDARDARLVTYLPAGRYLVSDTIQGVIGVVRWDDWPYEGWADPWEAEASFEYPCVLMGSREGGRSTLVLADGAPGFGDPSRPKPVLYFWARSMQVSGRAVKDPNVPQQNINFNQKILSLDIELGQGNPGAIGIDHRGAEGATVEDVRVDARGAFAGFRHAPGSGGAMHGIAVHGGRYGLHLLGTQPSPLISDLELVGQTEASILAATRGPLTLVGAHIRGVGIVGRKPSPHWDGALNIVDSVIELEADGPAVTMPRSVVLSNVWVKNAQTVIRVDDHPPLAGTVDDWTHVELYAAGGRVRYPDPLDGKRWRDALWVEREQRTEPVVRVQRRAGGPPDDLLRRHRLPRLPSPFSSDVAVFRCQGEDVSEALQAMIDEHDVVFLPKGNYELSKPLRLGTDTTLFGASNLITCLQPVKGAPAYSNPTEPQPLIDTVDDRDARTTVAMLRLEVPVLNPCVYAMRWRAGRNSVVQNVYPSRPLWHPNAPAMNHAMMRIEASGGGRWYTQTFLGGWAQGPDHRNLLVAGTREPLRFYHLQPQFARGNAMIELRDAENVDIYSTKAEGDFTMLWLHDCRRVRVFGFNGMLLPAPRRSIFRVEGCESCLFANIQPMMPRIGYYMGHLINYDPRTWHILTDGDTKIGGLQQFALYSTGPDERPSGESR